MEEGTMPESSQDTPRTQYADLQKAHILKAAEKLFAERGYHRTTTKAIAEQAGLSEGAIYYHFEGKRDLLIQVLNNIVRDTRNGGEAGITPPGDLRSIFAGSIKSRLQKMQPHSAAFFALLSDILTDEELAHHMYQTMILPTIQSSEKMLQSLVERGVIRPVDTALVVRMVYALTFGIDILWIMNDQVMQSAVEDADHLAEVFASILLDGLDPAALEKTQDADAS
jgi:AcrR family transcriptional regulator